MWWISRSFAAATSFATVSRTSSPGDISGVFEAWAEIAVVAADKTTIAASVGQHAIARLCSTQFILAGLAQVDVQVDEAGRDDEPACVERFVGAAADLPDC